MVSASRGSRNGATEATTKKPIPSAISIVMSGLSARWTASPMEAPAVRASTSAANWPGAAPRRGGPAPTAAGATPGGSGPRQPARSATPVRERARRVRISIMRHRRVSSCTDRATDDREHGPGRQDVPRCNRHDVAGQHDEVGQLARLRATRSGPRRARVGGVEREDAQRSSRVRRSSGAQPSGGCPDGSCRVMAA